MQDRIATERSIMRGVMVWEAMNDSGYDGATLAELVGCSQGSISRLISGARGGSARELIRVLDHCDVTDQERAVILALRAGCGLCGCACLPLADGCERSELEFIRQLRAESDLRGRTDLHRSWITQIQGHTHPPVE